MRFLFFILLLFSFSPDSLPQGNTEATTVNEVDEGFDNIVNSLIFAVVDRGAVNITRDKKVVVVIAFNEEGYWVGSELYADPKAFRLRLEDEVRSWLSDPESKT